jgi:hypothetical protein
MHAGHYIGEKLFLIEAGELYPFWTTSLDAAQQAQARARCPWGIVLKLLLFQPRPPLLFQPRLALSPDRASCGISTPNK